MARLYARTMAQRLILASQSPRLREVLDMTPISNYTPSPSLPSMKKHFRSNSPRLLYLPRNIPKYSQSPRYFNLLNIGHGNFILKGKQHQFPPWSKAWDMGQPLLKSSKLVFFIFFSAGFSYFFAIRPSVSPSLPPHQVSPPDNLLHHLCGA